MPAEKNRILRVIVPTIVAIAGIGMAVTVYVGMTRSPSGATPPPATTPATPAGTEAPGAERASHGEPPTAQEPQPHEPPALTEAAPPLSADAAEPAATATGELRARPIGADIDDDATPIGSLVQGSGQRLKIEFTLFGAGVRSITATDFFHTLGQQDNYELQRRMEVPLEGGRRLLLTSLAARGVEINGQFVDLFSAAGRPLWQETAPGTFEAIIVDERDDPVVRLRKAYTIRPDSFEIEVRQSAENLTAAPMSVVWFQYGPIEMPEDTAGYGIDVRRVRFGFLLDPTRDPSGQFVEADSKLEGRAAIVKRALGGVDTQLWPSPNGDARFGRLVWVAQTNRYFAFSVHPLIDAAAAAANIADFAASPIDKAFRLAERIDAVVWRTGGQGTERLLLQMTSEPLRIEAGANADLSFGAYAGPLGRRQLSARADPIFGALGLDRLVIYNLGGMCAFCTFQWLAKGLLAFLTFLHDYIVFDWALAIMVLVVCVRAVLHPVTRRSQIGLMRFSKQMQRLAPKQQKLREKYKDDPKRMQQEMIKLMREEGVSYVGMLGCLPMFLQTPIWIALYAMLYFSFDLRHTPAFYGFFQTMTGGRWSFLGDLSAADHFIDFGRTLITIPLFGSISGFNILPILLGVVFYIQQKYLTPPPTTALTPEQQQQQKIMKIMMVVMFPVLMYNAPSGLAIYFITNSTLGILESRWIRSHVDKLDLEPPKPKPAGDRKKVANQSPRNPFAKRRDDSRTQFKKRDR